MCAKTSTLKKIDGQLMSLLDIIVVSKLQIVCNNSLNSLAVLVVYTEYNESYEDLQPNNNAFIHQRH